MSIAQTGVIALIKYPRPLSRACRGGRHGHCKVYTPFRKSCICPCHLVEKAVPTPKNWKTVGMSWSCEGCDEGSKDGFAQVPVKVIFAEARMHRIVTGHITFVYKLCRNEVGTVGSEGR